MDIINGLIFAIFTLWGLICIFSSQTRYTFAVGRHLYSYSKEMHWLFIVITSSFFFGSNFLYLTRISIFTIIAFLYLTRKGKFIISRNLSLKIYTLFFLWLFYTLTYSRGLEQGVLMIVKYMIPIVFLFFSYFAVNSIKDYYAWMKRINTLFIIYILIHGFAPIGIIEDNLFGWDFWGGDHGYAMATFLGIPLSLFAITGKKRYLLCALLYALPPVSFIRRTAFGAYFIVLTVFLIYRYRFRGIIIVIAASICVLLAIVSINPLRERFFGGDRGDASFVKFDDVAYGEAELNTSGRDAMWAIVLNRFYTGHEIKGSGLGTMKKYLISNKNENKEYFLILHNDYLHLLCETGIIGVALWLLFYLAVITNLLKSVFARNGLVITYSALNTLGSFLAIGFVMYFANVVSTPFIFILPFVLLGFHFKLLRLENKKRLSQLKLAVYEE